MRTLTTALVLGSYLTVTGGAALVAAPAAANEAPTTYVACNQYNECWRVHHRYAYPTDQVITIHDGGWYDAHQQDSHWRWLSDPADDR